MRKIVFGTVVYKQAIPFFDDFLLCLKNQTIYDFELLIINDNLSKCELEMLEYKLLKYNFTDRYFIIQGENKTGFLSDFRIQMLLAAKQAEYQLLIIGDIDDLFAENRVESVFKSYRENQQAMFYYNNLVDRNRKPILKDLPQTVADINVISQCNFLGMSNTAVNLNKVSDELLQDLYEGSCNIFDWYLYSRLLLAGGVGVFVESTSTIYRIYANNLAGIQSDSLAEIEKERMVKIAHYERLEPFSIRFLDYKKQLLNLFITEAFYKTNNFNKNDTGYWWNNIRLEEKDV